MKCFVVLASFFLLLAVFTDARDPDTNRLSENIERASFCPEDEEWWRCAPGCERSCTAPNRPQHCDRPCIPYGCTCADKHFRDNQGTGRCVKIEKCKQWGPSG